jgi:type IV pilus assembly protein PilN
VADRRRSRGVGFLKKMRIDINLASRPYEDTGRFWRGWGSALTGLILLTLVLVYSAFTGWWAAAKDRELMRQREQQIAARDREKQNAEALLNRPENASTRDRSQFLNDLFERKAFSWTRVFEDLERVMPAHLHVVSIRPEMSQEHELELQMIVAGESRERALELVRNMEDSRRFQQTQITEESVAVMQTSGDKVQFQISTLYVPEMEIAQRSRR